MTTAPPSLDPPLPRTFGPYTLFDRVGRGGMAEIFLARERGELGAVRLVVVKQMLPELATSPAFAELLIAEAKLAARLRHGNVAQVYDLGRHDGLLFIAMEYVEGLDLGDLLRRCTRQRLPLPAEFALHIAVEMLRGLEHAHRCPGDDGQPLHLVHRDVSPSNVLVSFEGEVKLCDFGIAHANDSLLAPSGVIQGKAGYMAPEQARGEPLDARADVFAAGIVLWELLAGRRYYRASEGQALLDVARQASFHPLPPGALPHHDQIAQVVSRALDSDRAARYPSAQAMRRDLEAYLDRSGLITSSLALGSWLREHFADATLERRHRRERVLQALERGPALILTPLGSALPGGDSAGLLPEFAGGPWPASRAPHPGDEITAEEPVASGAPVSDASVSDGSVSDASATNRTPASRTPASGAPPSGAPPSGAPPSGAPPSGVARVSPRGEPGARLGLGGADDETGSGRRWVVGPVVAALLVLAALIAYRLG